MRPDIEKHFARLSIGTVQFGLHYGVTNHHGQVSPIDAARILGVAKTAGISALDTAVAYGNSEQRLGSIGVAEWQVTSKLPAAPPSVRTSTEAYRWALDSLTGSLSRLRVPKLHALLFHRPADVIGPFGEALLSAALELKQQGVIGKVGYSIYSPRELDQLHNVFWPDVVQAPFNILDRSLEDTGWLQRLAENGTEIQCRSVFLQGVLIAHPQHRPAYFDQWSELWDEWDEWLAANGQSALEICLRFVLSRARISRIVVGIDSVDQLEQLITCIRHSEFDTECISSLPEFLHNPDPRLTDPSRWPTR